MGDGQTENTATWKLKTSPDIVQESSSLKLPAWLLNPIWPRGGAHCAPPCHVFAHICANTRRSALKKLDFS